MPEVRLQGVSKSFNGTDVIRDVSVDIADGEFCVLVGPSGSGKSTLLRLIAGLEEATQGDIFIGARKVTHDPPKSRDIAMVFQSYALYPQLTVRDNMGFGLRLAGVPKATIAAKVDAVADMLGLTALLDRLPRQLSGGQRQRVAMGRAMVREPAVFLFDEPLSNLDAALRASVRAEIRAMHARERTTSVYVTHDQVEAMTMGERIVVLRAGRVEQVGTPLQLYERPVNRFVAGFMGSPAMNFCELPLHGVDSQTHAVLDGQRLALPSQASAAATICMGVRPEHLHLGRHDGDGATLPAEVLALEFMGAQSQLTLATPAGPLLLCSQDRPSLRVGERTVLGLPGLHLHFFDNSTGLRLAAEAA